MHTPVPDEPVRSLPAAQPAPAAGDVTALLVAWGGGDAQALEALLPAVYAELRRQARL